ncbi:MAG: flagellar basal body rod protein FlgB [Verrucomicrobiota bacterium]
MINALFNQPNYLATKKMLDATVLRQEAITSNIANLETPNYKRLDVAPSFSSDLRQAIASKNPTQIENLRPHLIVDSAAFSPKRDGNTVQLEDEMLHLNQNFVEHSLETQLVSASLSRLRMAITGRSG